ncbi:MAG: hypothetical protein ACLVA3_01865 [Blautia wexlerae]
MNALLVDDDRFVVAALEKKINWEQLTITEVLTAFNIRQAQKIIEKTPSISVFAISKCPAVLVLIFFPGSGIRKRNTIYFPDQLCGF